jgi:hypothetical protein
LITNADNLGLLGEHTPSSSCATRSVIITGDVLQPTALMHNARRINNFFNM